MAKHVIFLGAGASYTSGYPLADKLRIILSSDNEFKKYVADKKKSLANRLWGDFTHCAKAVRLFREGGFGSIDEFCYLAGSPFQKDVQDLKRFVAFIFALHDPEDPKVLYPKPGSREEEDKVTAFAHSDYYPFIQRLFDEDFHHLRKDVAVLTYNYDPYLEFVLSRAYMVRKEAVTGKKIMLNDVPPSVLSGLGNPDDDCPLSSEEKGFCLLKLHGTSVLPTFPNEDLKPHALTFKDVFENELIASLNSKLGSIENVILTPPIFFPWELIENDKYVDEGKFRQCEGETAGKDTRLNKKGR